MKCSICWTQMDDRRQTCNALPVNDGRCCAECDDLIVTPVRLARAHSMSISAALVIGRHIYRTLQHMKGEQKAW
jgi:hypothetical protein